MVRDTDRSGKRIDQRGPRPDPEQSEGQLVGARDPQTETAPGHGTQLCQTATTLGSVTSGVLYAYDQLNNMTDQWEYDYGAAPAIGAGCAQATSNYLRHRNTYDCVK